MLNTLTRSALARPLLLLLTIITTGSVALAQPQDANAFVQLIPKPRRIEIKRDRFPLGINTRILLAASRSQDDRFAADDFSNDLRVTANLSLRISTAKARHSILIGSIDLPAIQAQ